jgi:hypothetical protein
MADEETKQAGATPVNELSEKLSASGDDEAIPTTDDAPSSETVHGDAEAEADAKAADTDADDEEDVEYPAAWRLGLITIALCLSVFCMALVGFYHARLPGRPG